MKIKVLVIDDEEEVRKAIYNSLSTLPMDQEAISLSQKSAALFGTTVELSPSSFLADENFEVSLVGSGEAGILVIKDSIQNKNPFQVVFIDIRMPGMGGDECGCLIRELDPNIGICMVTGYSDKNVTMLVKNIGGGVDNLLFLKKPFSDDEVRQISRAFSARWYAELKSRAFQRGLQNLVEDILNLKNIPLHDLQEMLRAILNHILAFIGVKNGFIAMIDPNGQLHFEVGSGFFKGQQDIDSIKLPETFYLKNTNPNGQNFIMEQFNQNIFISMPDLEVRRVVVVSGHESRENESQYFIKILSENAAVSLKNAELFKKLQEAKSSLEIKIKERTSELENVNKSLKELAIRDHLTSLYNRRYFEEILEIEVTRSKNENKDLALMMIDIDFFKSINDKYGHNEGDDVLTNLAEILTNNLSKTDIVSRYGGDEFIVMLDHVDSKEAYSIANRISNLFSSLPFKNKYPDINLELSIGIAFLISDIYYIKNGADFFKMVFLALYLAKRNGRNRIETWKLSDELYTPQHDIQWENIQMLIDRIGDLSFKTRDGYIDEIAAIISVLENKDSFTANHSRNVAFYTKEFLSTLNLKKKYAEEIHRAAILHDIGKIGVPDKILLKTEALTADEIKIIENHPLLSVKILKQSLFRGKEVLMVKHHHERYDGKGYPDGIKQKYIPYGSRIIAITDAFDALTNSRPYRPKKSLNEAVEELRRCSGSQFDPELLAKFLDLVEKNKDRWPISK